MTKTLLSKGLEDHEAGVCPRGCPYCLIEFERVWGVRVVSSTAASNNKVEVDPNGIKPGEPGAKLDSGKVDVGIIFEAFPRALYAVAQVANFGASKYSRGGWRSVENGVQRYDAAFGRHLLERHKGEALDPQSKLPHRYHEVWNALASLELVIQQEEDSNGTSVGSKG
ncbi:hypothetical protein [Pseudomonas phage HMGUpa2]|nr:dATP/dGTP diphosphohydrolase domain-containing protein [Pseudomonas aeruginosa]AYD79727.1 hypothetical protein CKDKEFKM_00035 [Pseudomonas phage phiPA01_EW]QVJ12807.1 hypothetical protein [Pseudomonas phage PSA13]QVJ12879.1 hypothetical protein [Pseudomonas phage PSA16]QVJ13240.1 hypothetical protein [Pseudomonas phage PSA31]QVJ13346.1 hypothetical protein [Pseudomonas phage PSA34]QVJ13386.1 hypothetical protein [Pseudomonas phage PSA37]QVJ13576.1 hypothetical protein [Pseudomonas phage P